MTKSLTIRLEPSLQKDLEDRAPAGMPLQAVVGVLLKWGMERAKGMSVEEFTTAITRHRMKVAAESAEERLKRQQEAALNPKGGPFGHLYPDPED